MKTKRRKINEIRSHFLYEFLQGSGIKVKAIYSYVEEMQTPCSLFSFYTREVKLLAVFFDP